MDFISEPGMSSIWAVFTAFSYSKNKFMQNIHENFPLEYQFRDISASGFVYRHKLKEFLFNFFNTIDEQYFDGNLPFWMCHKDDDVFGIYEFKKGKRSNPRKPITLYYVPDFEFRFSAILFVVLMLFF